MFLDFGANLKEDVYNNSGLYNNTSLFVIIIF